MAGGGLGGFLGSYIKTGSSTITTSGNYTVPANFRSIVATVNPGNPGNPGCPFPIPCSGPVGGSPGNAGNPSTFKGAGTTTYTRQTSSLIPRQSIAVTIGIGGDGGIGGCAGAAPPGNPGNPGCVVVVVS